MRLLALLAALALAAPGGVDRIPILAARPAAVELEPLKVRLNAPAGWSVNDSRSRSRWASLYFERAKDPQEASIDVFFHPAGTLRGRPEGFAAHLKRLPFRESAAEPRQEKLGERTVWTATFDYETTAHPFTGRAARATFRETYLWMEHPAGLVALRLQTPVAAHNVHRAAFRTAAASVQPL